MVEGTPTPNNSRSRSLSPKPAPAPSILAKQTAGEISAIFRQRAAFMKTWKPASSPSNRDRLELYALHEQAVWGDAPPQVASSLSTAERAKYAAWKAKTGMQQQEAKRMYVEECDRQLRVYGMTPQTPENTPATSNQQSAIEPAGKGGGSITKATNGGSPRSNSTRQPGGLAAIPLLCAAASESRKAYLRRLANTRLEQAWWGRQNALCATPGSILALPETTVIKFAAFLELISLTAEGTLPFKATIIQSWLWPLHNCLLSLWMSTILVSNGWVAVYQLAKTILFGSRASGLTLDGIWADEIIPSQQSIGSLMDSTQPLTARLVGLFLLPYTIVTTLTNVLPFQLVKSVMYCVVMGMTWWYWCLTLPWFGFWLLGGAVLAGNVFALMDIAGF